MHSPQARKHQGFTLVELVAVIVLLGFVGTASVQFIRQGVGIYVDSARRDNLQHQARFAVERVSRELKNALPGSVRILRDNQCVEFMPIKSATTYLSSIVNASITTLDVVDFNYVYAAGDQLAIYTFDNNSVYGGSPSVTDLTAAAAGSVANTQTLNFDAITISNESPTRRAYIISGPVSFCASDGELRRHAGYTLSSDPPTAASGILLSDNIRVDDGGAVTVFDYSFDSLQRAGTVLLDFRFQDASATDEWLRLDQTVFVRNVP
jgi:MSHA biogenesis protein MshO